MKRWIIAGLGIGVFLGILSSQVWGAKVRAQETVSTHVMGAAFDRSTSQFTVQDYGPSAPSGIRAVAVCYAYGSHGIFCMPPVQ